MCSTVQCVSATHAKLTCWHWQSQGPGLSRDLWPLQVFLSSCRHGLGAGTQMCWTMTCLSSRASPTQHQMRQGTIRALWTSPGKSSPGWGLWGYYWGLSTPFQTWVGLKTTLNLRNPFDGTQTQNTTSLLASNTQPPAEIRTNFWMMPRCFTFNTHSNEITV